MMRGVTSACKLGKESLAAVAIQKMCIALWYGQIELVRGKILRVELQIFQLLKDAISND